MTSGGLCGANVVDKSDVGGFTARHRCRTDRGMATETLTLSTLVELAVETASSEWGPVYDSVPALDPAELTGTIEIASGFYGEYLADGWHRVAGMLRWAEASGADVDAVEIPIVRVAAP
jgi:hypothetical protein